MATDFNYELWTAYAKKKAKYGILNGWCEDYPLIMDKIAQELYDEFGVWI